MKQYLTLAFGLLCSLPVSAHAGIVINEVAWMGTAVGPNEEWIELFNDGDSSVSVDSWTLSDGVSLNIVLTGTIGAGEYALLERTDDDTVSGVTALTLYSGALSNDGRTLTLKQGNGSEEDRVVGGEAWAAIGGDNTTKNTPQRTQTGWITAAPTPGEVNAVVGTETPDDDDTDEDTESGDTHKSSGSFLVKKATPKPLVLGVTSDGLQTVVTAPTYAYVNQEVTFEVTPFGIGPTLIASLAYMWNFGDTYTGDGKKTTHTFEYPGEYLVVVEAAFAKNKALTRHEITVLPTTLSLSRSPTGDIVIRNGSKFEVDIGGFVLKGVESLTLPRLTILKPGGLLTIAANRVGSIGSNVLLSDLEKTVVATETPVPVVRSFQQKSAAVNSEAKTVTVKNEIPAVVSSSQVPTTTVITIGSKDAAPATQESGFFKKVISRVLNIFGL